MARRRGRYLRRRWRRLTRNQRLVVTAVAAGLLIAAVHGGAAAAPAAPATPAVAVAAGGSNQELANAMAAASPYGWTGQQAECLDWLWTRESGFDDEAANPTSDARGIAQDINGWSADYEPGNARQQISWGLAYIAATYGTPCAAWSHEEAAGWY